MPTEASEVSDEVKRLSVFVNLLVTEGNTSSCVLVTMLLLKLLVPCGCVDGRVGGKGCGLGACLFGEVAVASILSSSTLFG